MKNLAGFNAEGFSQFTFAPSAASVQELTGFLWRLEMYVITFYYFLVMEKRKLRRKTQDFVTVNYFFII